MDYLPIFLDLKQQPCLIVGGGLVATRKARNLLKAGASLTLITPAADKNLLALAESGKIQLQSRRFEDDDIDGQRLVIAATNDRAVNQRIADLCHRQRILVNVVDDPSHCDFVVPSIIDRSPVVAAVSTGGASPVLARMIRARLEALIPISYGRLGQLCSDFRDAVKKRFATSEQRAAFWNRVLQGNVAEYMLTGQTEAAHQALQHALDAADDRPGVGEVYLVGAGPGDPDLLTLRALRLIQKADVLVYDRLVAKPILDLAREDARLIYVGKERNRHAVRQEEINRLLADLALQGNQVVRLKGGDPFIFGRGGEEIDTLASENIPFQVIPGITAASGCAAYSGIPLTHRDHAQSLTLVTGHLKDGTANLNWSQLAHGEQTLVFYMGLQGLPLIARELIRHGRAKDTPAALVQQGTTHLHRVYSGTLETLPDIVAEQKPVPPTLLIVGEVVQLREKYAWYQAPSRSDQGATNQVAPDEMPFSSH